MAELVADAAQASDDEPRSKRTARCSGGARKRADDTQKLAMEKVESAGLILSTAAACAKVDPLAMPQRTLPTDATGNPIPTAQRNFTVFGSYILEGGDGCIQGYNAKQ